ncbi:hypothetical protein ACX80N_01390 [Arthrobacter sp. MDT2-16]
MTAAPTVPAPSTRLDPFAVPVRRSCEPAFAYSSVWTHLLERPPGHAAVRRRDTGAAHLFLR